MNQKNGRIAAGVVMVLLSILFFSTLYYEFTPAFTVLGIVTLAAGVYNIYRAVRKSGNTKGSKRSGPDGDFKL
ncbi:hypothetical protein [Cohnella soli]|uniref:Uncharacterized protein n=1 Tax=Cohnella soli TaxID=425005 RepID=A0ABW0HPC4_9BACL